MKYSLERAVGVVRTVTERDEATGVVYVYQKMPDRWDVYKFGRAEVVDYSVAELVSVTEPRYRVTAGECTCEGFKFRERCRHVDRVRDAVQSVS